MNSAELTALHTETLTDMERQRTLAYMTRRAATLWEDGYAVIERTTDTIEGTALTTESLAVLTPKGKRYGIFLSDKPTDPEFGDFCTCPAFPKYGECKHHLAVLALVHEEEQCAQYEALYADADADAYAEY